MRDDTNRRAVCRRGRNFRRVVGVAIANGGQARLCNQHVRPGHEMTGIYQGPRIESSFAQDFVIRLARAFGHEYVHE